MEEGEEAGSSAEEDRRSALNATRLRISHLKLDTSQDLVSAVQRAAELSARTLDVARVGVWLLGEHRASLVSMALFDQNAPPESLELPLASWPAYAAAIDSRRIIAVQDVATDPATRELKSYFEPRRITSMLDAPIFIGGEVWGIVCHEHVGPSRQWQDRETDFAISVADMLSALLEQARRIAVESELRSQQIITSRARRADALMRMASGVGHDFNTVLQTIMLLVQASAGEDDATVRRSLNDDILEECRRGARFVGRILDFARGTTAVPSRLELGEIALGMRPSLERLLAPTQTLHIDLEPDVILHAQRAEIEQVIINLVINARDAMPDGEIRVTIARIDGQPSLSISDRGVGIAPEHLDRIFDPFFTTKGDKGTGLGLTTVQAIVEARGGNISVVSTVGEGTTLRLEWPAPSDAIDSLR